MKLILFLIPVALAGQSVSYTYDATGLLTLSYNGHNWLNYVNGNAITNPFFSSNGVTCALDGFSPTLSSTSTGTNFTQHVYNNGGAHQFTVRWDWSSPAADTFKVQVTVTNQSSGDTMCGADLATPGLTLPSGVVDTATWDGGVKQSLPNQALGYADLTGGGSFAFWRGEVNANTYLQTFRNGGTPLSFDAMMRWGFSYGPVVYRDFLATGGNKVFTEYYRFSTSQPGADSLASAAEALWVAAYPTAVAWPDRRPVGVLFLSNNPAGNGAFYPNNPRGWLNDSSLNALNPTTFHSAMAARFASTLAVMNGLSPKPQGLVVWDVEGQEWGQTFSYVGNPAALPAITTEMDAIADEMIGTITSAGYKVGFTLRPQTFTTGTSLPGTCATNADANRQPHFVLTTATPPNRGYRCTSTNTWTQMALGEQFDQFDASAVVADLQAKITYAANRWGASMFYVDSNGWYQNDLMQFSIFRTLQQNNPTVIIFPEIAFPSYFGGAGQFTKMVNGAYRTPAGDATIYPGAFSLIDVSDADLSANAAAVRAGMGRGDVPMFRSWFSDSNIAPMTSRYVEAQKANSSLVMTDSRTGKTLSFSGDLGKNYLSYPPVLRVYFASSAAGLAASTTWCEQRGGVTCWASGARQPTASLDLSGLGFFDWRYYDFAGAPVRAGAPRGL